MKSRSSTPSRLTRFAKRRLLPLQRAWLRSRVGKLVIEEVEGASLVVLPDVFNPAVFRTTPILLEVMADYCKPGDRVLDVGTGTGVLAIHAALAGAKVIAVDANPEAIRSARINMLLNRVNEVVDVRLGDLFAPVADEFFDLVVCNPPFFKGQPRDLRDRAWRSDNFLDRFVAGLDGVLAANGKALIVFSSHGDEAGLLAKFADAGLHLQRAVAKDLATEVITVYAFARTASAKRAKRGASPIPTRWQEEPRTETPAEPRRSPEPKKARAPEREEDGS